ncbi:MAG: GNAT family N-acetyltransferase [Promethearchaeota archaeon]|nr:MAG: GNAT family N-acetyltransferase [Candidatus Lokiarchaeota archaeon]
MPFLPNDFIIPLILETKLYRLRMLCEQDLELDYEAVTSSIEHLKHTFGPNSNWPSEDLTLEQNLEDLRRHENEFKNRESFAYTVVSLNEGRCLGCVYIHPLKSYLKVDKDNYDAVIYTWVRTSELKRGLDEKLYITVKKWLKSYWPFKNPIFPRREIDWDKLHRNR